MASVDKVKYLGDISSKATNLEFFELLGELYKGALLFLRNNPKLPSINDSFMKNSDKKLKEDILGESIEKSNGSIITGLRMWRD